MGKQKSQLTVVQLIDFLISDPDKILDLLVLRIPKEKLALQALSSFPTTYENELSTLRKEKSPTLGVELFFLSDP